MCICKWLVKGVISVLSQLMGYIPGLHPQGPRVRMRWCPWLTKVCHLAMVKPFSIVMIKVSIRFLYIRSNDSPMFMSHVYLCACNAYITIIILYLYIYIHKCIRVFVHGMYILRICAYTRLTGDTWDPISRQQDSSTVAVLYKSDPGVTHSWQDFKGGSGKSTETISFIYRYIMGV